jgi:hypothetical protein
MLASRSHGVNPVALTWRHPKNDDGQLTWATQVNPTVPEAGAEQAGVAAGTVATVLDMGSQGAGGVVYGFYPSAAQADWSPLRQSAADCLCRLWEDRGGSETGEANPSARPSRVSPRGILCLSESLCRITTLDDVWVSGICLPAGESWCIVLAAGVVGYCVVSSDRSPRGRLVCFVYIVRTGGDRSSGPVFFVFLGRRA